MFGTIKITRNYLYGVKLAIFTGLTNEKSTLEFNFEITNQIFPALEITEKVEDKRLLPAHQGSIAKLTAILSRVPVNSHYII